MGQEVGPGDVCSCSNHTQELLNTSPSLEQWKPWGFDQMLAGWASIQKAEFLVIGQNTLLFSISINSEGRETTHAF